MRRGLVLPDRRARRSRAAAPIAIMAMFLVLSGCAANPADIVEARYLCENGVSFRAAFDRRNERVTVTFPTMRPLVLPQARSGSGFRYTDRRRELRGKGDEALWIESDDTQLRCKAQPGPR